MDQSTKMDQTTKMVENTKKNESNSKFFGKKLIFFFRNTFKMQSCILECGKTGCSKKERMIEEAFQKGCRGRWSV